MEIKLTAAMMYADYGHLEDEVKALDEGGIDSFHVDIMDGHYVRNFIMSINDMRCIAATTSKPLDVHLMIEHPNDCIDLFLQHLRKGDTIYIHPETEYYPSISLQEIINAELIPGIAIHPGTSVESVMEMLPIVKKILLMSVNPGNIGQLYIPYINEKITKLLSIKKDMDFEIYWDGACSSDKILEYAPKGVKGFVLGTALLFGHGKSYGNTLQAIRELRF